MEDKNDKTTPSSNFNEEEKGFLCDDCGNLLTGNELQCPKCNAPVIKIKIICPKCKYLISERYGTYSTKKGVNGYIDESIKCPNGCKVKPNFDSNYLQFPPLKKKAKF